MATVARKVSVVVNDGAALLGPNTALKATYANAAAGDITQLSTNKVLLVVDADGTTSSSEQEILSMVEAAVVALKRSWQTSTTPANSSAATTAHYVSR